MTFPFELLAVDALNQWRSRGTVRLLFGTPGSDPTLSSRDVCDVYS